MTKTRAGGNQQIAGITGVWYATCSRNIRQVIMYTCGQPAGNEKNMEQGPNQGKEVKLTLDMMESALFSAETGLDDIYPRLLDEQKEKVAGPLRDLRRDFDDLKKRLIQ